MGIECDEIFLVFVAQVFFEQIDQQDCWSAFVEPSSVFMNGFCLVVAWKFLLIERECVFEGIHCLIISLVFLSQVFFEQID